MVLERNQILGCDGRTKSHWQKRQISPVSSGRLGSRIATIESGTIPALMAIRVMVVPIIRIRSSSDGRFAKPRQQRIRPIERIRAAAA